MGGAVSSGRDNNELVDNLMSGNYIRTRAVEDVFRSLDRADYMSAEARDQAYKDLAWRNGPLHLSAPCIYSEVMEALELKPGLSFLNVGSGTGYLSTLVGLIIGSSGISHGVEAIPVVYDYANKKLSQFMENSITLDEFDFCMPKYYTGNGLCLAPTHTYDRVYCGAGVLSKYETYFKQFLKVGGVLVMPLADTLVQLRRVSESHWTKRNLLNVSFALLREPVQNELEDLIKLDEQCPSPLQALSRAAIRSAMRAGLMRRHPDLRSPPPAPPPAPRAAPRRICIPYDAGSDDELSELHDLDEAGGAHEMNALLSLVLSMGQNRAAGSLRLDPVDDEDLDEDYVDVNEVYEEGEEPALSPLLPDDGVIVFDVGGTMHARRWQTRGPRNKRAVSQEPGTSTEQPEAQAEDAAPASDTLVSLSDAETTQDSENVEKTETDAPGDTTATSDAAAPDDTTATSDAAAQGDTTATSDAAAPGDTTATSDAAAPGTSSKFKTRSKPEASSKSETSSKPEASSKSETSSKPETSSKSETKSRPSAKSTARSVSPRPRASARAPSRRAPTRRAPPPRGPWTDSSSCDEDVTQVKESKRQKLDSGIGEGTASSGASPDKSDAKSSVTDSSKSENEEDDDSDMEWCDGEEKAVDSTATYATSDDSSTDDSESDEDSSDDDEDDEDDGDDGDDGDEKDAEMEDEDEDDGIGARTLLKRKKLDSGIGGGRHRQNCNLKQIHKKMAEAVAAQRRVDKRLRPRGATGRAGAGATAGVSGARGGAADTSDSGTEEAPPRARQPPSRDMRRVNLSLAMKRGVKELPLPHALKKYINYGRCYQF